MNTMEAVVTQIDCLDNINIVSFEAKGQNLRMMALELDKSIEIGSRVVLGAKATSIAIAKELNTQISISNQLKTRVQSVNNGKILSSIKLCFADAVLESIITQSSSSKMGLKEDDEVIALIKASELSIVGAV